MIGLDLTGFDLKSTIAKGVAVAATAAAGTQNANASGAPATPSQADVSSVITTGGDFAPTAIYDCYAVVNHYGQVCCAASVS